MTYLHVLLNGKLKLIVQLLNARKRREKYFLFFAFIHLHMLFLYVSSITSLLRQSFIIFFYPDEFAKLRAFVPYVPSHLMRTTRLTRLDAFVPYVPPCLTCLLALRALIFMHPNYAPCASYLRTLLMRY